MPGNILIIDDEDLVAQSLSLLISRQGYSVIVASSGQEALEKIKTSDFALIICDVRMPGLDGIETIKRIRGYLAAQNKLPIPEVLISGYADSAKFESGMELDVAQYLYKPFDNEDLMRVIKKFIP